MLSKSVCLKFYHTDLTRKPIFAKVKTLRNFSNSNPVIRPIKWWVAARYYDALLKKFIDNPAKHEIRVVGMRRTGNHAILQWVISLMDGHCFFCNDLPKDSPLSKAPIRTFEKGAGAERYLLCTYEDQSPQNIFNSTAEEGMTLAGPSATQTDLLFIRDPFNLFASRFVWKDPQGEAFRTDQNYRDHVVQLWKDVAKEYLDGESPAHRKRVNINYNQWFRDEAYRRDLAAQMGLTYRAGQREKVPEHGGGSSFEAQDKDGSGSKLKVLERWKNVAHEADYRAIFQDKELIELSEKIFGHLPDTEQLWS
ncbi:MAG: hypothetical protein ACI84C_002237 [Flavobacteriales bacterium]